MIALADDVVFHELPFGGVLLDRGELRVYRLSQRAAGVLRRALSGGHAVSPYASLLSEEDEDSALRDEVLRSLASRGLIRGGGRG
ncbi:actinodefensin-associated protein B [Umezawaea sp.]|uniref:actinodefensin-associated protein B n=1 Tax=Umezawaea sp. TaxID=1955258 RepID=UPI002ED0A4FB